MYGIYDTQDSCWLGDEHGPKLFEDFLVARVAAQVLDERLGNRPGRSKAREYGGGANRLRDEVQTKMSTLDALQRIEGGRVQ